MFPQIAPYLTELWGPFRLLESYLVLIGLGTCAAGLTTWIGLPRLWHVLPRDRGRENAVNAVKAVGKPTGGGFLVILMTIPWLFLVLPVNPRLSGVVGCLLLCMLTGYLDDRSHTPWSEFRKGFLDFVIALLTCLAICGGGNMTIWLPLVKTVFIMPPWLFIPLGTVVLWLAVNAVNCSDGVDGLAGTLVMLSLFYLGGFLYVVIGHEKIADYLLVPHNVHGADWAILVFTVAGALAGYLWHNAEPSAILMGDAGSRSLGLLIGVAVLVSGNPFLILVVAPVILLNGGAGLVKLVLLRMMKKMGFDTAKPDGKPAREDGSRARAQYHFLRLLHSIRFPLHDHVRHRRKWSNTQVLLRFALIQAFLTPFLLLLLVKLR
ncbi:MAG: phospho-N-acetylmuramoyl-pentapeptide-transferase [Lentisphaeria bacterium]|nr:phospho-N-acetylmuramoyl-pentapeptide-transferase [Lentisphaeria bacterium]